jgi:hypothetical protein
MKNIQKLLLISFFIYIISTVAMTCLYFFFHSFATVYSIEYITTVVTQIGMIASILPTITMFLIYYFIKKIKSKLLLSFSIIILVMFLLFTIYWHSLNMMFYQLEDSKPFLKSLIEAF